MAVGLSLIVINWNAPLKLRYANCVDADEVARAINEIVRKLEGHADGDVPSEKVGELVMSSLHTLDQLLMCATLRCIAIFVRPKILRPLSKDW